MEDWIAVALVGTGVAGWVLGMVTSPKRRDDPQMDLNTIINTVRRIELRLVELEVIAKRRG